jgi:lipoprotein-anchoring transpeptidase ErfK/SrfK
MMTKPIPPLVLMALLFLGGGNAGAQLFKKNKKKETPPAQSERLAPGAYEWHPERAPAGPILVVVSIDDQIAYVYRNGVQIARSTVSTGAPGHDTPTGVFTILEK